MALTSFLKPNKLFKLFWFVFGLAGLAIVINQYAPNLFTNLNNSSLVKGVQTEILKSLNQDTAVSQQTTTAVSNVISTEIKKVIAEQTEVIKEFPQKQVRKIKIGACEELLEEDICAVASELQCNNQE